VQESVLEWTLRDVCERLGASVAIDGFEQKRPSPL
jgi:hypothetical protein